MKIKICGLNDTQNMAEIGVLRPDFAGFIFYGKSPRNLSVPIPDLPESVIRTGVFVDADAAFIRQKIQSHQLGAVQFHGSEPPELLDRFRHEVVTIKAFSIAAGFDFGTLSDYEPCCDYLLFDTKGAQKGGNGTQFNWRLLEQYRGATPYFLSGGIGPNDAWAIQNSGLPIAGVDLNSLFETRPGHKDLNLLKTFIQQLKTCTK